MKTEQQLQNIRDALVWWATIPPEHVAKGLSHWREPATPRPWDAPVEPVCGTIACFGGHCVSQPSLQAQGITVGDASGAPMLVWDDGNLVTHEYGVALKLFGDRSLFHWRNGCDFDCGFIGTDHELVTYRLQCALAQG